MPMTGGGDGDNRVCRSLGAAGAAAAVLDAMASNLITRNGLQPLQERTQEVLQDTQPTELAFRSNLPT